MRAVVLRKPFDLALTEVARPDPGAGEVLVRMTESDADGRMKIILEN